MHQKLVEIYTVTSGRNCGTTSIVGNLQGDRRMSSYVLVGAFCGWGVNLFSNAVRKLPFMTKPYEHVLAMGVGGYAGYRLELWEQRQIKSLIAELEALGKSSKVIKKMDTTE
jgi:hypothetical protein